MSRNRIFIGKLPVDVIGFEEAVRAIDALVEEGKGGFVVTPNVDHVVIAEDDPRFAAAYEAASLSLCDGFPLLVTSRMMRSPLPEKISGSDVTLPLLALAEERGRRVYLCGAGPGVAEKAAEKIRERHPRIEICGIDSPMVNLKEPKESRAPIVEKIVASKADIVLVAFGAPKQEIFCHEISEAAAPAVLLGIGATLDFIAGTVKRAPPWMSRVGLEWAFRLGQEPRRLFERYVIRDSRYPGIVIKRHLARRRTAT